MRDLGAPGLNPVFGIAGFKNAGKTTLVVDLVREFTRRGLRVGTVKHAHHAFDIDHPGKDSWLHREAGAREVIVASARRWAHVRELEEGPEPALEELLEHLGPLDLVLVEGYKRDAHPKLEVRRLETAREPPLCLHDAGIRAIVSDDPHPEVAVPVLPRREVPGIADFILRALGIPTAP
ncbi:MAG: molybdopterin-guanine dinucleotide biosynthesis protein B [Chromatiales bacterium]|nr:molybdopterin-guanine dinucleotide biosynthesis protein B [Chromatiales bacterium]